MSTTTDPPRESEATILARVLGNEHGQLSPEFARHLLSVQFSERDRERMHELAVRNQADTLTAAERDEHVAYTRAGTLLSLLKSRARRTLGATPESAPTP